MRVVEFITGRIAVPSVPLQCSVLVKTDFGTWVLPLLQASALQSDPTEARFEGLELRPA